MVSLAFPFTEVEIDRLGLLIEENRTLEPV
jgi:hypothetical protein